VLAEAARGVIALDGVGLSVLEISHRSKPFEAILAEAKASIKRLLAVPDTHEILFLQGGARGQFAMLPLNFLGDGKVGTYVVTGAWAKYALKEAQGMGEAKAVATGESTNFAALPDLSGVELPAGTAYVHTTSNNTIAGTQWQELPSFPGARHVCDMSSDILSRPLNVSDFAMIYAGAQKNAGPSGVTMVIVDKAWLEEARTDIPTIWRYKTHLDNDSMFNTPPCFAIYVVGLVGKWLESIGGLEAMAARNEEKAALLYDALESSGGYYTLPVKEKAHRSLMNVVWRIANEELESVFVKEANEAGLANLKGHRSVGGLRASIYNAMPREGVECLVDFLADFQKRH